MKFAVIKTGGKQYLVHENEDIYVDRLSAEAKKEVEFETLAAGDTEKKALDLGMPTLQTKVKGIVEDNLKGDKIRVSRFKAKVRYRRVKGFRPFLTKIKITKI